APPICRKIEEPRPARRSFPGEAPPRRSVCAPRTAALSPGRGCGPVAQASGWSRSAIQPLKRRVSMREWTFTRRQWLLGSLAAVIGLEAEAPGKEHRGSGQKAGPAEFSACCPCFHSEVSTSCQYAGKASHAD